MGYNINDIEKIVEFKTWTVKQKTDELLKIDCFMYCNLGRDSTVKEREQVRRDSKRIYTLIKRIDPAMGNTFLTTIDKKE
jgi:hypothetical protein